MVASSTELCSNTATAENNNKHSNQNNKVAYNVSTPHRGEMWATQTKQWGVVDSHVIATVTEAALQFQAGTGTCEKTQLQQREEAHGEFRMREDPISVRRARATLSDPAEIALPRPAMPCWTGLFWVVWGHVRLPCEILHHYDNYFSGGRVCMYVLRSLKQLKLQFDPGH